MLNRTGVDLARAAASTLGADVAGDRGGAAVFMDATGAAVLASVPPEHAEAPRVVVAMSATTTMARPGRWPVLTRRLDDSDSSDVPPTAARAEGGATQGSDQECTRPEAMHTVLGAAGAAVTG